MIAAKELHSSGWPGTLQRWNKAHLSPLPHFPTPGPTVCWASPLSKLEQPVWRRFALSCTGSGGWNVSGIWGRSGHISCSAPIALMLAEEGGVDGIRAKRPTVPPEHPSHCVRLHNQIAFVEQHKEAAQNPRRVFFIKLSLCPLLIYLCLYYGSPEEPVENRAPLC